MRAVLVLLVLLASLASAQQPNPKQRTQTSVQGWYKCGDRYGNWLQDCVNLNADKLEACRARLGTFAQRAALGSPVCPNLLFIVTDCASNTCAAGGGSVKCTTRANDAGTAWVVGNCDGSGSGDPGYTLQTSCTDGSGSNASAVQSAINGLTTGRVVVPANTKCGIESSITLKSNVSLRCEGGGGFKAKSGVGASGMFVATSSLSNVSIEGCDFDMSDLSGIEGISITGPFANIRIANNRFHDWANAFAVELWDVDSDVGRDSWLDSNVFEGSGVRATNDSGARVSGFAGGLVLVNNQGLVSSQNRFVGLGGINLQAAGTTISLADQVQQPRRHAVYADGPINVIGMGVTCAAGGDTPTMTYRDAIFTFKSSAAMSGVGVQCLESKVVVEHLGGGGLTIADSFLAGAGYDPVVTGTASSTSSTTTVHEASKSWTTDEWKDYEVVVAASGGGCGLSTAQRRWISANTSTTLTFAPALPAQADSCTYKIVGAGMVVAYKPAYVQIDNTNFDNASINFTAPDFDQVVIYDLTVSGNITDNVFSGVHPTGHAAVRVVSSEANKVNHGTATAAAGSSSSTIVVSPSPTWNVNRFVGMYAEITGGSCAAGAVGTKQKIVANTADTAFTVAFAGSTQGCTFGFRKYDFSPLVIESNTFGLQCPQGICATYGCIEYDRQVSGGGSFRGQRISNSFADTNAGFPWCRPVVGWDPSYGKTEPGGVQTITGFCLGGASSTYYLGTGCTTTAADTAQPVDGSYEVSGLKAMVDAGSGAVVTLQKNGLDTALSCTEAAGGCTDTADFVRFEPGDTRAVKIAMPGPSGYASCNTTTHVGCTHHIQLTVQP